jgi:hypothetical protein
MASSSVQLTSAEVRSQLVEALQLDLVGPTPDNRDHAQEILLQAPSKWYLTGFLVPYGASLEVRSDDTGDEQLEQSAEGSTSEDTVVPDNPSARKALFPASMGLSCLIPSTTMQLKVEVHWGDYLAIELPELAQPSESQSKAKPPEGWQRYPQHAELTVTLATHPRPIQLDVPGGSGLKLVVSKRPVRSTQLPAGTQAVSIFLVNYRTVPSDQKRDVTFAFQTCLKVHSDVGFVPRPDPRGGNNNDWEEDVANLQYRNDYEYAVGHNVSVLTNVTNGICQEVCTTWIPTAEVPRVAPVTIPGVSLGMEALADAPDAATIRQMVGAIVTAYADWIAHQRQVPQSDPSCAKVADDLLNQADSARKRIELGLQSLDDSDVLAAFKIANRAIAIARRQQLIQEGKSPDSIKPPEWRPFQLAFLLLNLVGIAQPTHRDRQVVDLLFFPTGGGKTEAYLGLAAFTLVLRRLRHPGIQAAGVSVLMRYTLRLLTLDQLERAARLICALELERQNNPHQLGTLPFEIGLWVGQGATPNKMGKQGDKDENSARQRLREFKSGKRGSPIPLERCPWCGETFKPDSFQLHPSEATPTNLNIICMSRKCQFRSDRPLPIVAVDEPIYRRLPCFIIATVDKFANLPWIGQTGALFGRVTHHNPGDGFYGPADGKKTLGQRLDNSLPPPDLIIQDELHLISGPLGTMVGLYETAIDALCSVPVNGSTIRPKIIASTATVRRADRQIRALFGRSEVDIFPSPGPDRHDSFFAETVPIDQTPGRLYIGVAAQGRSLKVILLRTYLALLSAAQKQWQMAGGKKADPNPADPYMTLLGYFNSLRELGGSRRIIEDEVNSRLNNYGDRARYHETDSPFVSRKIDEEPEELTSRVSTDKVANTKRRLALPFGDKEDVDVALATNMISVGLDIVRLGLMVVLGQPKTAAEYIQATSRVGRDPNRPGLVITLLNIYRHRDRSHYERFQPWHTSFYRAVEATSVTPFSPRALERGLAGVTVALSRLGISDMTPAIGASLIAQHSTALDAVVETISRRAEAHNPELSATAAETLRQEVRGQVKDLLDTWTHIAERDKRLQYQREEEMVAPLLLDALDPKADKEPTERQKFKAYRSLRDVEPTVNLWVRDPYGSEMEADQS